MPAAAKTTAEDIVAAATALVDASGADAVTMQAVAAAVGIKGPSLYKRFPHRDLLLDEVVRGALQELDERLAAARQREGDPLLAMCRAYRAFAKRRPRVYALMFLDRAEGSDLQPHRAETVKPLLELVAARVGEAEALNAARLVTSFLHGFISMELAGAFRLGGDTQEAFEAALRRLLSSLSPTEGRGPG